MLFESDSAAAGGGGRSDPWAKMQKLKNHKISKPQRFKKSRNQWLSYWSLESLNFWVSAFLQFWEFLHFGPGRNISPLPPAPKNWKSPRIINLDIHQLRNSKASPLNYSTYDWCTPGLCKVRCRGSEGDPCIRPKSRPGARSAGRSARAKNVFKT